MLFCLLLIAASPLIFARPDESGFNCINPDKPRGEQRIIQTSKMTLSLRTSSCPTFDKCMSKCITTLEYNPICGTDHVTYPNRGSLCCAQRCGKDVKIKHPGPCKSNEPSD